MDRISQEEPSGCGIACVASALGISYKKAKVLFAKPDNAILGGYYCRDLIKALSKKGLNYSFSKVNSKNKKLVNSKGSIVFIKRSAKYPEGHYLINTGKGWMDPWINYANMNPARAGIRKSLPGMAEWVVYGSEI